MQKFGFFVLIVMLSCSTDSKEELSGKAQDSTSQTLIKEYPKPVTAPVPKTMEDRRPFDTLPDYETFQEYLALFKSSSLPVVYDSLYVRSIQGNSSSRLRFSRFFKLQDLKEPEELNAFYARDKFDLGNGRIGVTIVTDIAPEVVGPDGELKTVNFIVYDKEGKMLSEKTVFSFYNVFELMEYSWGELDKDLMVYQYYYNSSVDEKGEEIIDRGNEMKPLSSL